MQYDNMKAKGVVKDMVWPTGNMKPQGSTKPPYHHHQVSEAKPVSDTEPVDPGNVVRYVRKARPRSATHHDHYGLEYSYNNLGAPRGRRFSLIPSFPDTEWELESCLKCSKETEPDPTDEKHDGMSGEHLRPLLSLWKIASEKRTSPEKGSVRQNIQRHCGCVVRTSRRTDLMFK